MSRAAQIYDFTLAAGGSFEILAEGSYYRILSATGSIEVRRDGGSRLAPMLPGQGERDQFQRLTIRDLSGAPNSGLIIVADGTFIDDRITGEVSVIDGEKARTIAGGNFMTVAAQAAVAGQFSHVQLWNPTANRRLIVNAISVSSALASGVLIGPYNVALSTLAANLTMNKRIGGAVSSAQSRNQANAAVLPTSRGATIYVPAVVDKDVPLRGPIVIPPSQGLTLVNQTVNQDLIANFQYFEEAI